MMSQMSQMPRADTCAEILSFWTEVMRDPEAKMQDRLKAADLLAKAAGVFTDPSESKIPTLRVELSDAVQELSQ